MAFSPSNRGSLSLWPYCSNVFVESAPGVNCFRFAHSAEALSGLEPEWRSLYGPKLPRWFQNIVFLCIVSLFLCCCSGGTEVCTKLDLTWAERAPDSPQVGPLWGPFGGPRGPPKGSNRAKSGELQPDLAQIGPKLAPAGPKDPSLCPLGAPRGPPRAPKRAPREPPKGLEKQHELKTLSDDDFLLVSNILGNRPHSENHCFPTCFL